MAIEGNAAFINELTQLSSSIEQGKVQYPEGRIDLLQDLVTVRVKIRQLNLTQSHAKELKSIQNLCNTIILGQPAHRSYAKAFEFADRGHIELWDVVKRNFSEEGEKFAQVRELFTEMHTNTNLLEKALFDAARNGNFDVVKLLIEDERVDKSSITYSMGVAALKGHTDIVLLCASKDLGNFATFNTICEAAKGDHMDIVQMLLPIIDGPCKTNINDLLSVLMYREKNVELIKSLIADPRFEFSESLAFGNAVKYGLAEIISLLLQREIYLLGGSNSILSSTTEVILRSATELGHKDVVKILLQDKRFDYSHKQCLAIAASQGNVELVSLFLEDSRIIEQLGDALTYAVARGHAAVVSILLKDRRVDAAQCRKALVAAVENGRLEVLKEILALPSLNQEQLAGVVSLAVIKGFAEGVQCLLLDNRVDPQEVIKNNSFKIALEHNYTSTIQVLMLDRRINPATALLLAYKKGLTIPQRQFDAFNKVITHPRTQALSLLRQSLQQNHQQHPIFKKMIECICGSSLTVYGLPIRTIAGLDTVADIKSYLANPIVYLESDTSTKHHPRIIAAVRILFTAEEVKEHKRKIAKQERDRNRFNNVDDEARIGAVRAHFNTVIQPHFSTQFTSFGLTAIECQIRGMLLETIKQESQNKEIIAFINSLSVDDTKLLLQGDDATLMERAREHFTDSSSAAHTAWRAYDKWAAVDKKWPNLLTEPLKNADNAVYTVATVGLEEPTTKMASDLSREMAAYSFLLAIDKTDGDEDTRATRKTAFIAKIAEIRRAHNTNEQEQDDPSCLPGTISRFGDMWIAHAKNITPDAPKLLEEELRSLIIEKFQKVSRAEQSELHQALLRKTAYSKDLNSFIDGLVQETPSEQTNLYNALVMMSSYNAEDIIRDKTLISDEQLALRQKFIDSLGTYQELKLTLNNRLTARGSRALSDEEFSIYVPALLADIGGPWIVTQLTSILRQFASFENPFSYTVLQKGITQQAAIALLQKLLAAVEMEGKMSFIMNTAKFIAFGNIEGAQKKLLQTGIQTDALSEAINDLEKQNQSLAEKRGRKAALWDTLYQKKIVKSADLLKDIVDEVIDFELDLKTVLEQHNIQ